MVAGRRTEAGENRVAVAKFLVQRIGENSVLGVPLERSLALCGIAHHDQLLRILHRQHLQQKSVHDGENGGIRADAKRQRNHRDRSKAGALAQLPHCENEIADNSIHLNRSLLVAQCHHGIDLGRAISRDYAGHKAITASKTATARNVTGSVGFTS